MDLGKRVKNLSGAPDISLSDISAASIGWDVVNWSCAPNYWLENTTIDPPAHALEIGAGDNGGISLLLADLGYSVVSSSQRTPSEKAKTIHRRFGLEDRISYQQLDVLELDSVGRFDIITTKSVLGAVGGNANRGREMEAVGNIHRALRPGGEYWFAENARGSWVHEHLRNRFSWGEGGHGWHYLRSREVRDLMQPFESVSIQSFGVVGLLGQSESQRRFLGHADRVLQRVVPSDWRYIVAGVARKAP